MGGCEDPLLWDPGELLSVAHSDTLPGSDEGLSAAPFCCCDITPAHQQQYTLIAVIFFLALHLVQWRQVCIKLVAVVLNGCR